MFFSFPLWVTSALTNSTEKLSARSPFSPGVFSFFSLLFPLSFFFYHSLFYSSLLSRPTYFGRIEVARPSYFRQMNQSREVTRRRMAEIEPWNFPTLLARAPFPQPQISPPLIDSKFSELRPGNVRLFHPLGNLARPRSRSRFRRILFPSTIACD